jgi:hypothetical protein
LTPGPLPARDAFPLFPAEPDEDDEDVRDANEDNLPGLLLCWRASFFACVRKLFALPAFGTSDLIRPGLGRKRFSSSALMNASHDVQARKRPIFGYSAG